MFASQIILAETTLSEFMNMDEASRIEHFGDVISERNVQI